MSFLLWVGFGMACVGGLVMAVHRHITDEDLSEDMWMIGALLFISGLIAALIGAMMD